ncbi:MAG TPA: membrane protein insertase YidC [Prolixibacteraceae bacterium]|nr:membrane protein insertase YidC [Prolixibacteraceae bacterium]HPS12867.1 membrane protein insertase YidC [Prolixibacteraceae bacterium]
MNNSKNTIIGFVLIFAVLMIFNYVNKPSKEQIEKANQRRDSIELVQKQVQQEIEKNAQVGSFTNSEKDLLDSNGISLEKRNLYGDFSVSSTGKEELVVLENNLMKLTLSNKGGKVYSVELKNYKRYDKSPLYLIESGKLEQNLNFFAQNRNIKTDDLFFKPLTSEKVVTVNGPAVPKGKEGRIKYNQSNHGESKTVTMRLEAGAGHYIDYIYTLAHNSYEVGYQVRVVGMDHIINTNTGYMNFNFNFDVPRQERASTYGEDRYTTIYYKFKDADVEHLKTNKSDNKDLKTPVKWIGFKQLFFSSVLQADGSFPNASISTTKKDIKSPYLASFKSEIGLPFDGRGNQEYGMSFYFGPNHYQSLKEHGENMEKLIDLGWPIVREVNRYLIIPVFNFLRSKIANFGIIILLLTILIRIIVFYPTYKTQVSSAKMRALKPEIDEINKKYPPEKAMERQQATMELYKKVGVSPLGGCLPMLLQMPILMAMFFFFPGSIELRQQGFLWATDLSTYDSIVSWSAHIPILSSIYGNHVSLLTLLMTATTILQTKLTSSTQDTSAMPGMKYMLYFMPIFFMFMLNSYSSGLSYYYFLSNVFSIGQFYIIKSMVDEKKVRAQLMVASIKKKPVTKSKFQQRLEEMTKQQQMMQQQQRTPQRPPQQNKKK